MLFLFLKSTLINTAAVVVAGAAVVVVAVNVTDVCDATVVEVLGVVDIPPVLTDMAFAIAIPFRQLFL
jgi:hypothetical protein